MVQGWKGYEPVAVSKYRSDEDDFVTNHNKWKLELAWLTKALEPALQLLPTGTGIGDKPPPTNGSLAEIFASIQMSKIGLQDWSLSDLTIGLYLIYFQQASTSPVEEIKVEEYKIHKKRARPGENCRPRPGVRKLIQDIIKELRELVPNGSKCSIDSLLERTIKHIIFLQSITKHAEKLNKCTGLKLLNKEPSVQGSSCHEQGSSWAVEVGSNLKVCPIIVENSTMNGQMLIEMLCDECSHFLEIADAIYSTGLTLLKGGTEICGEKTRMQFVVEVQNNRNMHQMDILLSLVQLLQLKI